MVISNLAYWEVRQVTSVPSFSQPSKLTGHVNPNHAHLTCR